MGDVPGANWRLEQVGRRQEGRGAVGEERNIFSGIRPVLITEAEFRIVRVGRDMDGDGDGDAVSHG